MEPVTLTAAAIATLLITKAFEKTGEIIGEKTWHEGEKLLELLKEKEPSTANDIQLAQQQALDYGQAHLIGQQVEQAANKHPEIREAVEAVAKEAEPKLTTSIIENWQGINVKGGTNTISGNTFNF
jgi:undecaprenyl pyrophosphate synthase